MLAQHGGDDPAAALDEHAANAVAAQAGEEIFQIDVAISVGLYAKYLGAARADRCGALLGREQRGRDDGARALGQDVRVERDAQPAIDDDAHGRRAWSETDRELRIVGENGPDAHEHRVVRGAKLVR